jgi:hypothetical protein
MYAREMKALAFLIVAPLLCADEQTQKMTARLSEEAEAFRRIATQVVATETLHQRAKKPPSRFHPRIGAAAVSAPPVEWNERHLVSEYGFAIFGGSAAAVHELRQVISIDGRKVGETAKAQDALAKAITASDDVRKKEMLKDFEKHGLVGAVTDFGQLILLFTRRELEKYEFSMKGQQWLGGTRALVFSYKQIDGPESLTVIEGKTDRLRHLKLQGEIWVRPETWLPIRITLVSQEGDAPASIREEASVDYTMTPFGALMPSTIEHRELRGGQIAAENQFTYTDFHKFGASSDVKFGVPQ